MGQMITAPEGMTLRDTIHITDSQTGDPLTPDQPPTLVDVWVNGAVVDPKPAVAFTQQQDADNNPVVGAYHMTLSSAFATAGNHVLIKYTTMVNGQITRGQSEFSVVPSGGGGAIGRPQIG